MSTLKSRCAFTCLHQEPDQFDLWSPVSELGNIRDEKWETAPGWAEILVPIFFLPRCFYPIYSISVLSLLKNSYHSNFGVYSGQDRFFIFNKLKIVPNKYNFLCMSESFKFTIRWQPKSDLPGEWHAVAWLWFSVIGIAQKVQFTPSSAKRPSFLALSLHSSGFYSRPCHVLAGSS